MMNPNTKSRTSLVHQLAADQSLIDGLVKHASDIPSLVLGSQTVQNADLVGRIQPLITLAKAAADAHVAWLAAVAASRKARLEQRQIMNDLRQTLRARYSQSPIILADFGLQPVHPTPAAPKTLVAAAEKAKATRAARGTKGSKQLAEVQGNVTGVVVTPVEVTKVAPKA